MTELLINGRAVAVGDRISDEAEFGDCVVMDVDAENKRVQASSLTCGKGKFLVYADELVWDDVQKAWRMTS